MINDVATLSYLLFFPKSIIKKRRMKEWKKTHNKEFLYIISSFWIYSSRWRTRFLPHNLHITMLILITCLNNDPTCITLDSTYMHSNNNNNNNDNSYWLMKKKLVTLNKKNSIWVWKAERLHYAQSCCTFEIAISFFDVRLHACIRARTDNSKNLSETPISYTWNSIYGEFNKSFSVFLVFSLLLFWLFKCAMQKGTIFFSAKLNYVCIDRNIMYVYMQ